MEVPVKNVQGEVVGQLDLDERVFGLAPNQAVVHQTVVAQLANARKGTAGAKTRAEVAGGGRKPWRQKGTGRARAGSTRSPLWRGGGVVFGPHPRSYQQRIPRKMARLAMRSALSDKLASDELIVLEALTLEAPKAREMLGVLRTLGAEKNALVVLAKRDEGVARASANLPDVRAVTAEGLNLLDVLKCRKLVMTRDAVAAVSDRLTREIRRGPSAAEAVQEA